MKKILSLIFILSLISCGNNKNKEKHIQYVESDNIEVEKKINDFFNDPLLSHQGITRFDVSSDDKIEKYMQSVREQQVVNNYRNEETYTYDELKKISRKQIFCNNLTENGRLYKGMSKSFFTFKDDKIMQVMFINELAGGFGKKFRLMKSEVKNPEYVEIMAKKIIIEYRKQGMLDAMDKQGFTNFQLILTLPEFGSKSYNSEIYSIY